MQYKTVSILIPVHNEVKTVEEIISRVQIADTLGLEKEIIIVDDGSTDGTRELLHNLTSKVLLHDRNLGKGAAIRTGLMEATGDIILIQDADLEYNPGDIKTILSPIISGECKVVYGSRINRSSLNIIFSKLSNLITGQKLTDIMTGYKAFSREAIEKIKNNLKEDGFGIEVEITVKISRAGYKIKEVPISYSPRTYKEGKHMSLRGQAQSVLALMRYGFRKVGK